MESRKRKNYYGQRNYYVEGNTARQLELLPELPLEHDTRRVPRNTIRKNREKASHMNPGYVLFLSVASVVTFMICFQYIQLRSQITSRIENISTMETELSDLKIENDAELSRVNNSIDLEEIKRIAMEELGMVYASKEQVILYEDKDAEFFRQYESVTNE
ncbi:MAG: cell division protein FtsL [Lachnospiraceae bacterium]|nr:cell division protein FtsL [Lachnospiraceae bacterium]